MSNTEKVLIIFGTILLTALITFPLGIAAGKRARPRRSNRPPIHIGVTIIQDYRNPQGQQMVLLETENGQRCYTKGEYGEEGDKFQIRVSELLHYTPMTISTIQERVEPE